MSKSGCISLGHKYPVRTPYDTICDHLRIRSKIVRTVISNGICDQMDVNDSG